MSLLVKRIVIVGGGTAGWLTAGVLAAEFNKPGSLIQISLVESPEVKTIGVGEGTWPSMRGTLEKIGISETQFIRECSAAFKQGSKFVGWKNGRDDDFYYHPFTVPQGFSEANLPLAWQTEFAGLSFCDAVCAQGYVCERGLAPKQITTPEYAGVINYGYHLDAGKFAQLLQRHCTEKLGVTHIQDHVESVNSAENGDISSLQLKSSGEIEGDLFIDCSGTHCLLLGQHFRIPFLDKKALSINDTAMATQIPYREETTPIASPTIATAQSAGWTWDIGLSSRRGVGYVYSSAHITDEQAERELRRYLAKSIGEAKAEEASARKISIQAGHRQLFWHKNCVAVGMSAGFIEPLEASALALVELSANMIRDELPMTREGMAIVAERFNKIFLYRWQRIMEFLKLHYVLTQRTDTEYWRDVVHPETIPDDLKKALVLWHQRPPYYRDFPQVEEIFPSASYHYVLFGMGFLPDAQGIAKKSDRIDIARGNIRDNIEKSRKYSAGLPSNRDLITHIFRYGMQKI